MHELSVCQALIDEIARVARSQDAERVTSVVVRVGPLAGIDPALLESAYALARVGTVAADAELVLEESGVRIRCPECGTQAEVECNQLECPSCHHWRTQVIAGDELVLASVALVRREEPMIHV